MEGGGGAQERLDGDPDCANKRCGKKKKKKGEESGHKGEEDEI